MIEPSKTLKQPFKENRRSICRPPFQPATLIAPISSIFEPLCCNHEEQPSSEHKKKTILTSCGRQMYHLGGAILNRNSMNNIKKSYHVHITLLFLCLWTSLRSSSPSCFLFWNYLKQKHSCIDIYLNKRAENKDIHKGSVLIFNWIFWKVKP